MNSVGTGIAADPAARTLTGLRPGAHVRGGVLVRPGLVSPVGVDAGSLHFPPPAFSSCHDASPRWLVMNRPFAVGILPQVACRCEPERRRRQTCICPGRGPEWCCCERRSQGWWPLSSSRKLRAWILLAKKEAPTMSRPALLLYVAILAGSLVGCSQQPAPDQPDRPSARVVIPEPGDVSAIVIRVEGGPANENRFPGVPFALRLTDRKDVTEVIGWLKQVDWTQEGMDLTQVKVMLAGSIEIVRREGAPISFLFTWDGVIHENRLR